MGEHCPNNGNDVLFSRVTNLENVVDEVKNAVKSIDQSLRTLASLEVKHEETRNGLNRAFTEIGDHETRMRTMENEMPTLKLVRGWVIAGVVGIMGILGVAILHLVLR